MPVPGTRQAKAASMSNVSPGNDRHGTGSGCARILLVGVNWLGDALMATPAVRAVRRAYPDAHLEILVPSRVADVYRRNPHLNGVIVYDDRAPILSASFWNTVSELRHRSFDTAILLHGSRTKARLTRWAHIPQRWGMAGDGREELLTRTAQPSPKGVHRAQTYLDLIGAFGIAADGRKIDFIPDSTAEASLERILQGAGMDISKPFAVVHAGGNWELKRWPVSHFRTWSQRFLEARPQASIVLSGAASEAETAHSIAEFLDPKRVFVLSGKTSLDELAFLFRKALFVLSNDSGPIHLAASQNARILGLFGPTAPSETGPWTEAPAEILWRDPGCEVPCYFRSCDSRVCMDRLSPESVLESALRLEAAR